MSPKLAALWQRSFHHGGHFSVRSIFESIQSGFHKCKTTKALLFIWKSSLAALLAAHVKEPNSRASGDADAMMPRSRESAACLRLVPPTRRKRRHRDVR